MANLPKGPKLRLHVTEEIIAASLAKDSQHCMIAEALRASRPDAKTISVDLQTIRFTDSARGLRYSYLTPRIAQVHLVNYDQGRRPPEFSFVLRSPHVTKSGQTKTPKKTLTPKQKATRTEAGRKLNEKLRTAKLVVRKKNSGSVPDRVGGQSAPLQVNTDNVPFTRRRAFGLRGLEY